MHSIFNKCILTVAHFSIQSSRIYSIGKYKKTAAMPDKPARPLHPGCLLAGCSTSKITNLKWSASFPRKRGDGRRSECGRFSLKERILQDGPGRAACVGGWRHGQPENGEYDFVVRQLVRSFGSALFSVRAAMPQVLSVCLDIWQRWSLSFRRFSTF